MKVSILRVNNATPQPVSSAASFGSVVRLGNTPYVFCFMTSSPGNCGPVPYITYFGSSDGGKTHDFYTRPADEFDRLFTITEGDSAPEIQRLLEAIFGAMARQIGTTNV